MPDLITSASTDPVERPSCNPAPDSVVSGLNMKTAVAALLAVLLLAFTGPALLGNKDGKAASNDQDKKKVIFMAGHRSHGYDQHEHRAGCLLLANQLNEHMGNHLEAEVHLAKG